MSDTARPVVAPRRRSLLESLEIDTRMLGMIAAFVVICVAFNIMTDGRFLSPRNIFNLSIQTVSVAIMATGMVFVIVTRHIDLSVGALLATCSAVMAMTQKAWLPDFMGLELGHPAIAPIAILAGLLVGTLIGAFQGWLVGYLTIPAFIVTLGGLLIWRNVAWYTTGGQTIGPLDETFQLFGGINGTLGVTLSWVLGLAAAAALVWSLFSARRGKLGHGFPVKPLWAEALLAALRADPFDPAALDAAMATMRGRLEAQLALGGEALRGLLLRMEPAERLAFADRLEKSLRREAARPGEGDRKGDDHKEGDQKHGDD